MAGEDEKCEAEVGVEVPDTGVDDYIQEGLDSLSYMYALCLYLVVAYHRFYESREMDHLATWFIQQNSCVSAIEMLEVYLIFFEIIAQV